MEENKGSEPGRRDGGNSEEGNTCEALGETEEGVQHCAITAEGDKSC